jgi:hypothetical protein
MPTWAVPHAGRPGHTWPGAAAGRRHTVAGRDLLPNFCAVGAVGAMGGATGRLGVRGRGGRRAGAWAGAWVLVTSKLTSKSGACSVCRSAVDGAVPVHPAAVLVTMAPSASDIQSAELLIDM